MERKLATTPSYLGEEKINEFQNKKIDTKKVINGMLDISDELINFNAGGQYTKIIQNIKKVISDLRKIKF